MASLPINAILGDISTVLADGLQAVVIAPPGAGKTTMVAPALLDQPWCTGRILLLSPRRIAARAAAERMAAQRGEDVGRTIGYATRMDSRQSAQTRILVLTEGLFRSMIIRDPELSGISAVLFDEVHERSLDSDFGLALALDAQAALRPDLRLVAMSATMDGARFAQLMNGAPIIACDGIAHSLRIRHIGRDAAQPLEAAMASAIRTASTEQAEGDLLAFLPGVREIDRAASQLEDWAQRADISVHRLHGNAPLDAQRAAMRADPDGRRKLILATNIAETSLTIDGVRVVIDSGLARRAHFDPVSGNTTLETQRASQAAATQRAGRAARQGPGVAYRLWREAGQGAMAAFDPPEVLSADLAPLVLDCLLWGEQDPCRLSWLDSPPVAALANARMRLHRIGAIDEAGQLTPHGRALARLPLAPELAHMLIAGAQAGDAAMAADLAMLLGERGLGGQGEDLCERRRRFQGQNDARAASARRMAKSWADMACQLARNDGAMSARRRRTAGNAAHLVATAYPDLVARRRDMTGEIWQSAGGRGLRLDPASPLAGSEWIAVAQTVGGARNARIAAACAFEEDEIGAWLSAQASETRSARYDRQTDRVIALRERRLGAIILSQGPDPDAEASDQMLCAAIRSEGLSLVPLDPACHALWSRCRFAGIAALDDEALLAELDHWLAPLLVGERRLSRIAPAALFQAMSDRLTWDERRRLDRIAPDHFATPAGSRHVIDYAADPGPTVTVRVQALFGLDQHPVVGDPPVPLAFSLTSPAGRPIQTTTDLPGFWRGSWADVVRDMRGRYPKHPWPDQPWTAPATLRTKRADAARRD